MENLLQSYFETLISLPRDDQKHANLPTDVNSVSNTTFREIFNEKLDSLIYDMDRFDSVLESACNVKKAEIDFKQAQIECLKTLSADLISETEKSNRIRQRLTDRATTKLEESKPISLPTEQIVAKVRSSEFLIPNLPKAPSLSDYGLTTTSVDSSKSQSTCCSSFPIDKSSKRENVTSSYRIPRAPQMSDYGLTAANLSSKNIDGSMKNDNLCVINVPKAPSLSDYGLTDKFPVGKALGTLEIIHIPKAPCLADYGLDPNFMKNSILSDKETKMLSEKQEADFEKGLSTYIRNSNPEEVKYGKDLQKQNEKSDQLAENRPKQPVDYVNNNDRRSKKHSNGANSGSMNGSFMDVSPTKFNYVDFLRKSNKVTAKLVFDNTDDSLTDIAK